MDITGRLNKVLRKNTSDAFELDGKPMSALEKCNKVVTSPLILALPHPELRFSTDTDASNYGIAETLFQAYSDGIRKPILNWPRALFRAEKNYSPPERECLSVVWPIKTLRPYILYEQFIAYTDHSSLQ